MKPIKFGSGLTYRPFGVARVLGALFEVSLVFHINTGTFRPHFTLDRFSTNRKGLIRVLRRRIALAGWAGSKVLS